MENGVSADVAHDGETALDIAIKYGNEHVAVEILKHIESAKVNIDMEMHSSMLIYVQATTAITQPPNCSYTWYIYWELFI